MPDLPPNPASSGNAQPAAVSPNQASIISPQPIPMPSASSQQNSVQDSVQVVNTTPSVVSIPDLTLSLNIQGNILAGFRKDHQIFAFLQLPPQDPARAKSWLNELLPRIAMTKEVANFNARFSAARLQRGGDDPENLQSKWVNIGLTANGLKCFGSAQVTADLASFQSNFSSFIAGAASRAPQLGDSLPDSDPSQWLVGGAGQSEVDVILTVAADNPDDLLVEMEKLRAIATKHGVVTLFEQRGNTLPGERAGHEHFGFKDGISQPGVRGFNKPRPVASQDGQDRSNEAADSTGTSVSTSLVAPGEFVLGYPREGGQALQTCPNWMKDGSFQVWRRLAQDVAGFWSQVTTQVSIAPDSMTQDQVAAKLMGRWRSGTPIDAAPSVDNRSAHDPQNDNDFDFSDRANDSAQIAPSIAPSTDTVGLRCPVDAHIRKMNPRNGEEATRRIIRRGIPFGLPFDPAAGRGQGVDADRGLLFMAFMASIENQFEFLQQFWANGNFPGGEAGPDPIIGLPTPANGQPTHKIPRDGLAPLPLTIKRFVRTTGAVYAFAPSLTTLRALAADIN